MTRIADLVDLAISGYEGYAKKLRVDPGKLRNVGGYLAVEIRAVFLMQLP